jgi:hypothetical protein
MLLEERSGAGGQACSVREPTKQDPFPIFSANPLSFTLYKCPVHKVPPESSTGQKLTVALWPRSANRFCDLQTWQKIGSNLIPLLLILIWCNITQTSEGVKTNEPKRTGLLSIVFDTDIWKYFLENCLYPWDVMYAKGTGQVIYERNNEGQSCNHRCRGKAISIAYCESVFVVLCIQPQCTCAILSFVAPLDLKYNTTHTEHNSRKKKVYWQTACFNFFLQICLKHFSF